jgi:molecular chaperone HtpG
MLAKLAKDEPAKYQGSGTEFGAVLKEGLAEDHANREKLLPLLRFATTDQQGRCEATSLADLRGAHADGSGQDLLRGWARASPPRAGIRLSRDARENVEVLLLGRRIDAWVMDHVQTFEGRKFKDATRGDLELGTLAMPPRRKRRMPRRTRPRRCSNRVKDSLGERVSDVRVSTRLKDSAAVLVAGEHDISAPLRRVLEAAGQQAPSSLPLLELNVGASPREVSRAPRGRRRVR